jgi:hypothetical protein
MFRCALLCQNLNCSIRAWDSRGHVYRTEYDTLRCPTKAFVQGADPQNINREVLFEQTLYGEGQPNDKTLNLRSRVFKHFDTAGVVTSEAYDFKGNLLLRSRGAVTEYFLSRGLLQSVFRITDPGALRLLPTFTVSVLSMTFTGVLTYWLVVGLYQSIHFYQAAMERQTRAAQLETQLSHAELENLKSQLHPHFLFNSLHTIGILMQENVDAASHLLVCLGDLLRTALERRENEITLQSELEFVGKYLEIEQTRFHDRLRVHMDVPPDLLGVYVPSLALQPLVENAIKHGISVDSAAGRLEIAAQSTTAESCSASAMTARARHRDRACDSASDLPMSSHA